MSKSKEKATSVLIFYHYFHPDDVVSARHLTGLACGLASEGFHVEAMPCNHSCRTTAVFTKYDEVEGVKIRRIYRPGFKQASSVGRVFNLAWMLIAWSLVSLLRKPDVLIIGTDPILSVLAAIPWKIFRPRTKIIHWCFDLYPDAAIESGLLKEDSVLARTLNRLRSRAFARCDAVVDIGPCMRERIEREDAMKCVKTLTPWALVEPDSPVPIDEEERLKVFGRTQLAILYSGNLGEAHSFKGLLALARAMRDEDVVFGFSVRGNKVADLKAAITADDTNIRFIPFADEASLDKRLACADVHIVTLRDSWEGIVVPSKFFGALAIGRPVLFDGPSSSSVARWIQEFDVGWIVGSNTAVQIADNSPEYQERSFEVYRNNFAYDQQISQWAALIRSVSS